MKRIRTPFCDIKSEIPIISVTLSNGEKTLALVDSGSETTLIDKDFIVKNRKVFKVSKSKDTGTLTGLNSKNEYVVVLADTYIQLEGTKQYFPLHGTIYPMDFVVKSLKECYGIEPKILIGSDTLHEYNAELNYEKRELIIKHDTSGK